MEDLYQEIRYLDWLNSGVFSNKNRMRVNFIKETYSLTKKETLNSSKSFISKQKMLRHRWKK